MAGWLGFYAHQTDAESLHQRLNADPEIAFILQEGPGRWRAFWQVDDLLGKTMLWHVPGGPLPLLGRSVEEPDALIEEPFAGWQERREGYDSSVPYFGPSWPSVLELKLVTPGWRGLPPDLMPMSGLSWPGPSGRKPAPPATLRWWRSFRNWMRRQSVRVTRWGPLEAPHADVWAMPAALRALQAGMERDDHPLLLHAPPRPWRLVTPGPD